MDYFAVNGDNVNAGIFWPEAYFNDWIYRQRIPTIEKLIPLAAHTVMVTHRLNPATISGLEIVFCDEAGLHKLSQESIESLVSTSEKWDREFGETVLSHELALTFENPDSY